MAQTFTVSKERSKPEVRKHRGKLVVSAISKTPITVSPLESREGKESTSKTKITNTKTSPDKTSKTGTSPDKITNTGTSNAALVPAQALGGHVPVVAPGARRGRPLKAKDPLKVPGGSPVAAPKKAKRKLTRTRQHRIDHARLLDAEGRSGKVPLAASRIVEQLKALLGRATVEAFRGKRDRPAVTLSKLEEQAIQEALVLFQLKVTLQRGGEVRRAVAS